MRLIIFLAAAWIQFFPLSPGGSNIISPLGDGDTARGIDISHHQKQIIWSNLPALDFVFIKATEGESHLDTRYKQNWDSAGLKKILRGAYHFYRPNINPVSQFSHFKRNVYLSPGDLPPVLDVEIIGRTSRGKLKSDVLKWLLMAEKHYGVTPILYTNWSFYKTHLSSPEIDRFPLWIANYVVENLDSLTAKWTFWQHTQEGRIPGISGDVDLNIFKGPKDSLFSLIKK
jgi:lysozyme